LIELTGEEINALGNEGYRLADTKPATAADELPFGVNTIVLTFKADGKEYLEYSAVVPADQSDVLTVCIGKEPLEVFVKLWQFNH
jgi:hypothetical protein